MIRKTLGIICLALLSGVVQAQLLSVTATLTDSDGTVWANATCTVQVYSPNGAPFFGSTPVPTTAQPCSVDGNGVLSTSIYNTSTITPSGALYQFSVGSHTSASASSFLTPIVAANSTAVISALLVAPRFSAYLIGAYGYADIEAVASAPNGQYFNVITGIQRQWNGSSWSSVGGSSVLPLPASPSVEYLFKEGSGTTIFDSSGNRFNATLGTAGRAPTWVPNGLKFPNSTGADMPTQSAINNIQTWCWVGNFTPLSQNGINTLGFPTTLASNDGGTSGVSYVVQYVGSLVGGAYGIAGGIGSISTFGNGSGITQINATFSGVTRLCVVRGKTASSTVDHIYINGAEVPNYFSQGHSGDITNTTFYTIGAIPAGNWTTGLFGSTMYRMDGWSSALTAAQILQADQVFQYDLTTRGISFVPTYAYNQLPQLALMGDSITFCQGVLPSSACWNAGTNLQSLLTNQPTYTTTNFGITSVTAFAVGAAEPGRGTNFCQTSAGPGMLTNWDGTNDIAQFTITNQQLVNNIAGAIQKYKLAGCRVFVATTISRCGNAPGSSCLATGTFEAARAAFNKLLLAQAKSFGADGIVDIASLPFIGATNAYNAGAGGGTCPGATTYFTSDCVHPNATAQPFISTVFANSLNYYTGSSLASPFIASGTSTLPSSARVTQSTCASACTLTLPDAIGPSGEIYTIITGSSVVSVQGQTLYGLNQTINGSSSPVALPTNSTVQLKIIPNAQATAGAVWVM